MYVSERRKRATACWPAHRPRATLRRIACSSPPPLKREMARVLLLYPAECVSLSILQRVLLLWQ